MQTWEYCCRTCGRYCEEKREVERRDDPLECPRCGGETYRLFAVPQILWAGRWAVRADPNDPAQWR